MSTVSLCIPSYNSAGTLVQAVESAENQTHKPDEIIIVDDCSTDDTQGVIERLAVKYGNLRTYENPSNLGLVGNWNRCIELAQSRFVSILHADDYYAPEMLARQLAAFDAHPEAGVVFTLANFVDGNGTSRGATRLPEELANAEGVYTLADILYALMRNHNSFVTCDSAMMRKDVAVRAGMFSDKCSQSMDLEMWFRMLEIAPAAILPEALIYYRVWAQQATYQYHKLRSVPGDFIGLMKEWSGAHREEIESRYGAEGYREASDRLKRFELIDLLEIHKNAVLKKERGPARDYIRAAKELIRQLPGAGASLKRKAAFFGFLDRLGLSGLYRALRKLRGG